MAWEYRRFVEAPTCSHTGCNFHESCRGEHGDYVLQSRRSSPFFGELPSYGGFSFGASTEMKIPPKAYFSPAKYRKIVPLSLFYGIFAVIFAKAYWGKNKMVGIFEASERHHLLPYARASHESCRGEPMRFSSAWFAR